MQKTVSPIRLESVQDMDADKESDLELDLFLEAIYRKYGYDFRLYSRASMKRRIKLQMERLKLNNICELIHVVLYNEKEFSDILSQMTVNVTEMFRDPDFYRAFRSHVVPALKTHPSLKIWHAGCSTGEEVYSMAILLKEAGLYERCYIYATDIDHHALDKAKKGIYDIDEMARYSQNYRDAGGLSSLSDYYTARYDSVIMDGSLKKNIIFANHDLVTDRSFAEMQVILCRNVVIYFNNQLQNRVYRLFTDSLDVSGFLCLGTKESIRFSESEPFYSVLDEKFRIYCKNKQNDLFDIQ